MKQYFILGYNSLRNHGFKLVIQRFFRYLLVKLKRIFQKKDENNLKKWESLKGKYSGNRVFILGNGPSLNETPLFLLRNEYKLCFNHFNLMFERIDWLLDFYIIVNDLVIKDAAKAVNSHLIYTLVARTKCAKSYIEDLYLALKRETHNSIIK